MVFPCNTVMNLLQDLVLREPRLAELTPNHHPAAPGQSCCLAPVSHELMQCITCSASLPPRCILHITCPCCALVFQSQRMQLPLACAELCDSCQQMQVLIVRVILAGSTIFPGAVVQGTNYSNLPYANVSTTGLQSLQTSAPAIGVMPPYMNQASAPQSSQLPLFSNMYNTAPSTFANLKDQTEGLSRGSSILSNLSCATAQPQLSSECLSSTNSEDSLLGGLTSSPCYQSSYSGGYINPFQAPNSPRMPVSPSLGDSALLEQTAAMMKAATAALQSLQSPPHLYHSPQRQQPQHTFAASAAQQHSYAPQVSSLPAMPSRGFVPVQTAPSISSIGMQALEELMMSDSSQDSSPFTGGSTLQSVQSAPASLYAQASQPWGLAPLPCPPQTLPANTQAQQEVSAHHSMSHVFDNITQSAELATTAAVAPAPKLRTLKRSVSDIPVFDCKAAAAAMAAREAAKAIEEAAAEATQAADQEPDFADLDLPLIDDCFLADMGNSDLDSDLTSGLCFDGFADFQQPCPGIDKSDSSSNLLAEQVLHFACEEPTPAPKRKGKQSKKLKARGGVVKASAQVCISIGCLHSLCSSVAAQACNAHSAVGVCVAVSCVMHASSFCCNATNMVC